MGSSSFDLASWLEGLKLGKFIPVFEENGIEDIDDLLSLDEANLNKMGIKQVGPVNKILRAIEAFKPQSTDFATPPAPVEHPLVPLPGSEEMETLSNGLKVYLYPRYSPTVAETLNLKTIMVIGETGSGKSTLLNAMVNYLCGVKLTDSFRYRLIDERAIQKDKGTQALSQTDTVNSYIIDDHGRNIRMKVIDTPGFKDTRGIERDDQIVGNIKNFFEKEIQEIDYVCLVVPATSARLTGDQRYVFNKILEIFGADVQKRILVLFTFCDGGEPNSMAALKADNVPVHKHFKFNNSALYSSSTDAFTAMFWAMGYNSLEGFFNHCRISQPLSLSQTLQVLTERAILDIKANDLATQLQVGLNELGSMQSLLIQLDGLKGIMSETANYQIVVEETYTVTERSGPNNTMCNVCHKVCHESCGYGDGEDKRNCSAMKSDGWCGCGHYWQSHNNYRKTIDIVKTKKVPKTLDDLRRKYVSAASDLGPKEQMLEGVKTKMAQCLEKFITDVGEMAAILKRLNQIALKPNTYDCDQYLDMMIENEEKSKKGEWQNRVQALRNMKSRMLMVKSIAEGTFDVQRLIKSYAIDVKGLDYTQINEFRQNPGASKKCTIQ